MSVAESVAGIFLRVSIENSAKAKAQRIRCAQMQEPAEARLKMKKKYCGERKLGTTQCRKSFEASLNESQSFSQKQQSTKPSNFTARSTELYNAN